MPPILMALVRRLVRWGVVPSTRAPDSAIVNIYEQDDCIPPHIDHNDFSRPFVTLSLLSQEHIMFGHKLIPLGPGEFGGDHTTIALPPGTACAACMLCAERQMLLQKGLGALAPLFPPASPPPPPPKKWVAFNNLQCLVALPGPHVAPDARKRAGSYCI